MKIMLIIGLLGNFSNHCNWHNEKLLFRSKQFCKRAKIDSAFVCVRSSSHTKVCCRRCGCSPLTHYTPLMSQRHWYMYPPGPHTHTHTSVSAGIRAPDSDRSKATRHRHFSWNKAGLQKQDHHHPSSCTSRLWNSPIIPAASLVLLLMFFVLLTVWRTLMFEASQTDKHVSHHPSPFMCSVVTTHMKLSSNQSEKLQWFLVNCLSRVLKHLCNSVK